MNDSGGMTRTTLHLADEIRDLERSRIEQPAAIERTCRERVRRAERLHEEAMAAAQSRFGREEEELNAAHAAESESLALDLAGRLNSIDREEADRTRTIEEWASSSLTAAQNQLQESIWVAESVYEGAIRGPEDRERAVLQSIEQRDELTETLRSEAQAMLRAYRHPLPADAPITPNDPEPGGAFDALESAVERVRDAHQRLSRERWSRLSSGLMPLVLIVTMAAIGATIAIAMVQSGTLLPGADAQEKEHIAPALIGTAGGCVAGVLLTVVFRLLGKRRTRRLMVTLLRAASEVSAYGARARIEAAAQRSEEQVALAETRDRDIARARGSLEPAMKGIDARRSRKLRQFVEEADEARRELTQMRTAEQDALRVRQQRAMDAFTGTRDRVMEEIDRACRTERDEATAERDAALAGFRRRWRQRMDEAGASVQQVLARDAQCAPEWTDERWDDWSRGGVQSTAFRVARLVVDRPAIAREADSGEASEASIDPMLADDLADLFALPVGPDLLDGSGLLIEADERGRAAAIELLRTAMMRILTLLPPGKARFTVIDPVGLGESFAGFMHLADADEKLVTSRIWTEPRHIEQRLIDLTEHMETVIQKYLRNEFETIEEYNREAGEIAEPYRFLVVADFPASISESAAARLASIIASGARCGVHVLIAHDRRSSVPASADLASMRARCVRLVHDPDDAHCPFSVVHEDRREPVLIDSPPPEAIMTRLLREIGEGARSTARVEVPFSVVAPGDNEIWSRTCSNALTIPLGRAGASRLQEITFGTGTSQHALLAGKTGSGKSTLLHVLITNAALWYPPDEVELYLIDFKKGVEFKTYASLRLPHARAVAVESDREFGLSVLQRVDQELRERGDLYRETGVQDLAGFRRARPGHRMPRVLLVVDEFQEMFVEDDRIGQEASLLLDRIVRQGRAFGIHVLLGSQTLGGAYSIARSTMGQIQIRIALQCSEADSYLIMSEDNAAARLLSRPGEAIYNDAGGRIEGNSPFQIVWLDEDERESRLSAIARRDDAAQRSSGEPMFVFEGSAPALLSSNPLLRSPAAPGDVLRAWIGDAVAIKGPTEVTLRPQSGSNVLVVGQREESAAAMFVSALASLVARRTAPAPRIILLDGLPVDSPLSGRLARAADVLGYEVEVPGYRDVEGMLGMLDEELTKRLDVALSDVQPVVLFVLGLQRFRMLRTSDDFSFSMEPTEGPPAPDKAFARLLREGPVHRMHSLLWCDTPANLSRTLERAVLREISMRVLFQMGGNDSTALIDSPAASLLGMHRALFYDEELGVLEKFRPYAMPDDEMLAALADGTIPVPPGAEEHKAGT